MLSLLTFPLAAALPLPKSPKSKGVSGGGADVERSNDRYRSTLYSSHGLCMIALAQPAGTTTLQYSDEQLLP